MGPYDDDDNNGEDNDNARVRVSMIVMDVPTSFILGACIMIKEFPERCDGAPGWTVMTGMALTGPPPSPPARHYAAVFFLSVACARVREKNNLKPVFV